jgi:pimeloyl-ACP methyl ester carboxylesterase
VHPRKSSLFSNCGIRIGRERCISDCAAQKIERLFECTIVLFVSRHVRLRASFFGTFRFKVAPQRRLTLGFGAPVGFRLAIRHLERITALISQNGNAYLEGLSEGWNPIQAYWKNPSAENRAALRAFLKPETTKWQYTHGVPSPERLSPDSWTLDSVLLARPGNDEIQLDLFGDYKSNIALYPKFQEYIRTQRPPLLAVWGKNDPFFLPAGAQAFKRDHPDAEVHLLEAGHFALESQGPEIAAIIRDFLERKLPKQARTS